MTGACIAYEFLSRIKTNKNLVHRASIRSSVAVVKLKSPLHVHQSPIVGIKRLLVHRPLRVEQLAPSTMLEIVIRTERLHLTQQHRGKTNHSTSHPPNMSEKLTRTTKPISHDPLTRTVRGFKHPDCTCHMWRSHFPIRDKGDQARGCPSSLTSC